LLGLLPRTFHFLLCDLAVFLCIPFGFFDLAVEKVESLAVCFVQPPFDRLPDIHT